MQGFPSIPCWTRQYEILYHHIRFKFEREDSNLDSYLTILDECLIWFDQLPAIGMAQYFFWVNVKNCINPYENLYKLSCTLYNPRKQKITFSLVISTRTKE